MSHRIEREITIVVGDSWPRLHAVLMQGVTTKFKDMLQYVKLILGYCYLFFQACKVLKMKIFLPSFRSINKVF